MRRASTTRGLDCDDGGTVDLSGVPSNSPDIACLSKLLASLSAWQASDIMAALFSEGDPG